MNKNFAILIDGGFVRKKLETKSHQTTGQTIINRMTESQLESLITKIIENFKLSRDDLYRIFYYDCMPVSGSATNPLSNQVIDFSTSDISKHNKSLFSALGKKDFFAMRMGDMSLVKNSWQLKRFALKPTRIQNNQITIDGKALEPNISQKGVDIKIGLDIATLALKKQIKKLILITGDSDFAPALKLARVEGLQIYLVTLGHNVMDNLKEHSDVLFTNNFNMQSLEFNQ